MILQTAMLLTSATVVFSSPSDGFHTFRIPSLYKSRKGPLLAFCEGRQSQSDAAQNQIVLKRSFDDGKTWRPLQVIAKMGGSLNNPCVVETTSGKLILHFQYYPAGTHEYDAVAGYYGAKVVQAYQMESQDAGATWGKLKALTKEIKNSEAATLASGPGIGIQLQRGRQKGRLLMPYNQRIDKRWSVYMAISDDQGKTWKRGRLVDQPDDVNGNEVQVVELAEGAVLLNARNQASGGQRCVAISHDGGNTFSRIALDSRLVDPVCHGSIVRLSWPDPNGPGVLAFSNPMDDKSRRNGHIQLSFDEGRTWPQRFLIDPASFQYSCLCSLSEKMAGILYERVTQDQYEIVFRTLNWKP